MPKLVDDVRRLYGRLRQHRRDGSGLRRLSGIALDAIRAAEHSHVEQPWIWWHQRGAGAAETLLTEGVQRTAKIGNQIVACFDTDR